MQQVAKRVMGPLACAQQALVEKAQKACVAAAEKLTQRELGLLVVGAATGAVAMGVVLYLRQPGEFDGHRLRSGAAPNESGEYREGGMPSHATVCRRLHHRTVPPRRAATARILARAAVTVFLGDTAGVGRDSATDNLWCAKGTVPAPTAPTLDPGQTDKEVRARCPYHRTPRCW